MPSDILKEFKAAREAVIRERQRLLKRLDEINQALGQLGEPRRTHGPRPDNAMNIREAIAKVTAKTPLNIREIVQAVQAIGYRFSSSNPANSVGAYLYGAGKKEFTKRDGKFSPRN